MQDPILQAIARVEQDRAAQIGGERQGRPSIFTCPECGGTLWQVDEPETLLFRCHVGHILSGLLLFAEQKEAAENSLWYTIRTLTDHAVLASELAEYARRRGDGDAAARLEATAAATAGMVRSLRQVAEGRSETAPAP